MYLSGPCDHLEQFWAASVPHGLADILAPEAPGAGCEALNCPTYAELALPLPKHTYTQSNCFDSFYQFSSLL